MKQLHTDIISLVEFYYRVAYNTSHARALWCSVQDTLPRATITVCDHVTTVVVAVWTTISVVGEMSRTQDDLATKTCTQFSEISISRPLSGDKRI